MKVAGVPADDPAMAAARARDPRARAARPRPTSSRRSCSRSSASTTGRAIPAMPVEIMLLPRWSYFNLLEVSYWSRTVIVPLLDPDGRQARELPAGSRGLDELWPVPARAREPPIPPGAAPVLAARPSSGRTSSSAWTTASRAGSASGPRPLRARAVEAARRWLEERLAVPGGLGGIFPAMTNAVLALQALGYPEDHPLIRGQIKEIEALGVETATVPALPALRVAGLGHRARRQRARRVGAARRSSRAPAGRPSG